MHAVAGSRAAADRRCREYVRTPERFYHGTQWNQTATVDVYISISLKQWTAANQDEWC
jgi:hypothetical protein